MARNAWTLTNTAKVALVAATTKTILQVVSAAGIVNAVSQILVSFDGISNTAQPVLVEVLRQSSAGTGGTARNPRALKDKSTAIQSTGLENIATTEPGAGDILVSELIHPQAGALVPLEIPDGEIEVASAARLGIRCTAPAAVNVVATMKGEE